MRAFLLAAFLLASVQPAFAAEDCTLLKAATLKLEDAGGGLIAVPVAINGVERKFLLDTGGAFTGLRQSLVNELHLAKGYGHNMVFTVKGKEDRGVVTVDEFGIGISKAKHFKLELIADAQLPAGIDGVLAPDLLRNFDLDFDFGARVLNLMSPKHCKGKVVYWTLDYATVPFDISDSGHISIPVTLDGKRLTAVVDTGAFGTVLSAVAAKYNFDLTASSANVELPKNASADTAVKYRKTFQSLSLEGISISNPTIYVRSRAMEDAMMSTVDPRLQTDTVYGPDFEKMDLLLGMNILGRLHMYVAYKEEMLYISAAKASPIGAAAPATPAAATTAP